jgi:hypothetical protein
LKQRLRRDSCGAQITQTNGNGPEYFAIQFKAAGDLRALAAHVQQRCAAPIAGIVDKLQKSATAIKSVNGVFALTLTIQAHPDLKDDALTKGRRRAALGDPSVKALTAFPSAIATSGGGNRHGCTLG